MGFVRALFRSYIGTQNFMKRNIRSTFFSVLPKIYGKNKRKGPKVAVGVILRSFA